MYSNRLDDTFVDNVNTAGETSMATMQKSDLGLIAHLMRRAGFGATRSELEEYASKDYEEIVEDLLHPDRFPDIENDVLERYIPNFTSLDDAAYFLWSGRWTYLMANTKRPLEEKIALFWHHIFATGWGKGEHTPSIVNQIEGFRRHGMGNIKTILLELSKDPAMIFWLDNNENHNGEPNENYGRELLELFSMGAGNYSEDDIKNAARAFSGWTFKQPLPIYPYSTAATEFEYREDDHDDGIKTFLGESGPFNGDDIIDIIVKQPSTAQFLSRHLYNFFVADEPPVAAWPLIPPQDVEAVEILATAFADSGGEIRSVLRTLFNSDFFKEARLKKVKSPAELVAGTLKLVGAFRTPQPGLAEIGTTTGVMGQALLNPPTVEGWHTGTEWIDGGTLNERVNFAVGQVGAPDRPGVQEIIDRLAADGGLLQPEELVNRCLNLVGPIEVSDETREALLKRTREGGALSFNTDSEQEASAARIQRLLQYIVATREYQFA